MKTEYIAKFIALLAGAVVCIVCVVKDVEIVRALWMLLATLIIFYIIGGIARKIIERVRDINTVMKLDETSAREAGEMYDDISGEQLREDSEGGEA